MFHINALHHHGHPSFHPFSHFVFPHTHTQSNTLEAIDPPLMLLPKDFTRDYANKEDVFLAHDLSPTPSVDAPCITVLIQDAALYLQHEDAASR